MQTQPLRPNIAVAMVAFAVLFGLMLSIARAFQSDQSSFWNVSGIGGSNLSAGQETGTPEVSSPGAAVGGVEDHVVGKAVGIPTPDNPHPLPPLRTEDEQYTVQAGDTLGKIADRFGVSLNQLIQTNQIADINLVEVGKTLLIPAPSPENAGPAFKIIPDSELVYGPSSMGFDIQAFIQGKGGYLASYYEDVNGTSMNGARIVERIAQNYSVNPRLLLAVLEYNSGWVTDSTPHEATLDYPIGIRDTWRKGLYRQLDWAGNSLSRGYYLWRVNGASAWRLANDAVVPVNPTINAGTAAVQHFFGLIFDRTNWEKAVQENGVFATYMGLFGNPFAYAVEPLIPPDLQQPTLRLPFQGEDAWAFTGGPHGAWGSGTAWAALDFAPPSDVLGCVDSDAWVTAVADGPILRTGDGAVIQDVSIPGGSPADGLEGTGWVIFYMHIETRDRVQPGENLKGGDRIGHPSCEGGYSTGTHVHLVRKYNGEWIPADQNLPFILDGWVSSGDGYEYNGYLQRSGEIVEAYSGRSEINAIRP